MGRIRTAGGITASVLLMASLTGPFSTGAHAATSSRQSRLSCASKANVCAEVADPEAAFGHDTYVGHDEPSVLFYSNKPGSGNNVRYQMTLPADPAGAFSSSKSYNFQIHAAFWFGMALCDTESYPEATPKCTPNSDSNITDPTQSKKHPGTAFMELQFYPPGYVQQFDGFSCDGTRWCSAMAIFGLSENPLTGKVLNAGCAARVAGGVEYTNFAYLTKSGTPQGPPDPLHFDFVKSGKPGPDVLYMSPGDDLSVTIHDTSHGLLTEVHDATTGETGSMVASADNGFGHMRFHSQPSKACQVVPYDFHPMYSTSSEKTRVPWAAHSYNVAFSDEIGHFESCTHIDPATGSCDGQEGSPTDQEAADGDDNACFPAEAATLYATTGCLDTNAPGYDGASYQAVWPDGSANHPSSVLFSSPRTGAGYADAFERSAFEFDLPRIEAGDLGGTCNRTTGENCTHVPVTDEGVPAEFYPYFSTVSTANGCRWGLGSTLPNTISNFGGNAQAGPLLLLDYYAFGGHGATVARYNDFRGVLSSNPC